MSRAMNRAREGLAATATMAAVAAATTLAAMLSWRGFTVEPARFLGPLFILAIVVAGTGTLARWWRLPGAAVVLVQVGVSGMLLSLMLTGSPLPVGAAYGELVQAYADAVATANRYAAPVPRTTPGVHPLLITGGWACLLMVDTLACTLRRVPLAGLPLLTVYSVPISMLGGGLSWWVFALTAAGFLGLLFLHENEQVARWGRPLGEDPTASDPSAFGVRTGAVRASAGAIGSAATALAVFVPLLIPTLNLHVFDFGPGSGGGSDISIENPITDMRRNLNRGDDIPLLRLRTDDPDPSYLRVSVLNRFSDNEWSSGDRDVPPNNLADGQLPPVLGVESGVNRQQFEYQVQVTEDFRSTWLPTQFPATRVVADGDWRYDDRTMDFIAGDDDLSTSGLSYSMSSVKLELEAESLARAVSSAGLVTREFTDLPSDMPSEVRNLATGVTREAPTRFEKAVALQQWFREDGGFTYDLSADEGNGTDELVRFLSEGDGGRTGYCEQFASAMAVMARILGIPARVAVGFLQPQPVGPNTWEYSAHDLHAWPELFFAGAGWVRFEPTPQGRASGVPAYTTQAISARNPTDGPSAQPSEDDPDRGATSSAATEAAAEEGEDAAAGGGFPWGPALGGLGGAVLVVALLLLPRTLRSSRRGRRLAGGPEEVWAELRATARDLRVPWPESRSPRETGSLLIESFGRPVDDYTPERPAHGADQAPAAVVALERIVRSLELLRYSRGGAAGGSLRSELGTCVAALEGGATRRNRRLATWWPRSVLELPRRTSRTDGPVAVEARLGGVVDHVG